MSLEELLEIISGNVVSEKRHQRILRALIDGPVGTWRSTMALDQAGAFTEEARRLSVELGPRAVEGLKLAWTLNPEDPDEGQASDRWGYEEACLADP